MYTPKYDNNLSSDVTQAAELQNQFHLQDLDDIYKSTSSTREGLTYYQRQKRLEIKKNILTPAKRVSPFMAFLKSQVDLFAILFWAATIGCFAIYWIQVDSGITGAESNLYTGFAVLFVNMFQGLMSYLQTKSSQKILDSFAKMIPQKTWVLQDKHQYEVNTEDVVVGDIVILKNGSKVPADIRLIETNNLKLDLSGFTGEAEPQLRTPNNTERIVLNATNMAFMTCAVMNGDGIGIVVATGDQTEIGKHKKSINAVKVVQTPIQIEIHKFVVFISVCSVVTGIVFFVVAIFCASSLLDSFVWAISLIIACIPEGLPISITVSLAQAAKRLAKKNVLVKQLTDVETLGSVSVICSDKTGTITRNQMTIHHIYDNKMVTDVKWNFERQQCEVQIPQIIKQVIALNSKAEFDVNDSEQNILKKKTFGDASESGILRFVDILFKQEQIGLNEYRTRYSKKFEIPFSSVYKYQLSIHKYTEMEDLVTLKGAPEIVLKLCGYYQDGDQVVAKNEQYEKQFNKIYEEIAKLGERVLGVGYCTLPSQDSYSDSFKFTDFNKIIYAGFVSLQDLPKDGVVEAVSDCVSAQIDIIMVTGDHYFTATAIAKQIGMFDDNVEYFTQPNESKNLDRYVSCINNPQFQEYCCQQKEDKQPQRIWIVENKNISGAVMTGDYLAELSDEQLGIFLSAYHHIAFARVTPDQKLRVVAKYQELGKVVAASGDGLNDAAALRKANVGVAMATGSQVARDAANIVLVDDSFATIVNGIKEGRLIFENLKKSMCYAMSTEIPELIPCVMYVACGFPTTLSSMIIILIDLATEIWPTFAMAFEVPEDDLMKRPPRNVNARLFDARAIYQSYVRVGLVQFISLMFFFCLGVMQTFYNYTGQNFPFGAFFSMSHDDFQSQTLPQLLSDANYNTSDIDNASQQIYYVGMTAAFMTLVETQITHAIMGRMRINSLWKQGIFSNKGILCTYPVQLIFGILFIYIPQLHDFLCTADIPAMYWVYGLVTALWLPVYDEVRRYVVRKLKPESRLRKWLYW